MPNNNKPATVTVFTLIANKREEIRPAILSGDEVAVTKLRKQIVKLMDKVRDDLRKQFDDALLAAKNSPVLGDDFLANVEPIRKPRTKKAGDASVLEDDGDDW